MVTKVWAAKVVAIATLWVIAIFALRVHFNEPQAVWFWCDMLGMCG